MVRLKILLNNKVFINLVFDTCEQRAEYIRNHAYRMIGVIALTKD